MTDANPTVLEFPAKRFHKTTLKDWRRLPIGLPGPDGKLVQAIDLVPYKFKQERELAKRKEAATTGGQFAEATLMVLLNSFATSTNFGQLKDTEKQLTVQAAYFPDVLYAFLLIRREAIGPLLTMTYDCPRCPKGSDPVKFDADLDTIDVNVLTDAKNLRWEVELRDGFSVCGAHRKVLTLEPPVWGKINTPSTDSDSDKLLAALRSSLVAVDGYDGPPMLLESEADEMSKYDFELIKASIEENTPGAQMVVEHKCERGHSFTKAIEWISDSFFSLGSQRPPKTS